MIKRILILLFLLFMLNLTYLPVYRTTVRQKNPVTITIKVESDVCTELLVMRNKEYFRSERIFLYISFKTKVYQNRGYYNSS